MNNQELGIAMATVVTEVKGLRKDFEKVATGEGFPRCARHKEKIDTIAGDVAGVQKSYIWLRNLLVAGLVTVIVAGSGAYFNHFLSTEAVASIESKE